MGITSPEMGFTLPGLEAAWETDSASGKLTYAINQTFQVPADVRTEEDIQLELHFFNPLEQFICAVPLDGTFQIPANDVINPLRFNLNPALEGGILNFQNGVATGAIIMNPVNGILPPPEIADTTTLSGRDGLNIHDFPTEHLANPGGFRKPFTAFWDGVINAEPIGQMELTFTDPDTGVTYFYSITVPFEGTGKSDKEPPVLDEQSVFFTYDRKNYQYHRNRLLRERRPTFDLVTGGGGVDETIYTTFDLMDETWLDLTSVRVFANGPLLESERLPGTTAQFVGGTPTHGKFAASFGVGSSAIDWEQIRELRADGIDPDLIVYATFRDMCGNEQTVVIDRLQLKELSLPEDVSKEEIPERDSVAPLVVELILNDGNPVTITGDGNTIINWCLTVIEDGSGLEEVVIVMSDGGFLNIVIDTTTAEATPGDGNSTVYKGEAALPKWAPSGEYFITSFLATDRAGNGGTDIKEGSTLPEDFSVEVIGSNNADSRVPRVSKVTKLPEDSGDSANDEWGGQIEKASELVVRADGPPIEVTVPEGGLDVSLAVTAVGLTILSSTQPSSLFRKPAMRLPGLTTLPSIWLGERKACPRAPTISWDLRQM